MNEEFVGENDLPNVRTFHLYGNDIRLIREDPFGFWVIKYAKGTVPRALSGKFTSTDEAKKALLFYLGKKGRTIKSVEE